MIIKEAVPFVILFTIVLALILLKRMDLANVYTIDGSFSLLGAFLGLFILLLNLVYTNNYLITIGPLLVIICLTYLHYRNKILVPNINYSSYLTASKLKIIKIIYWVCITVGLICYFYSAPYYRPLIFFISMSVGITMVSLDIISSKKNKNESTRILAKILLLSLIIRNSAFFISPYLVGSDPWGHSDFINDIYKFGSLNVPLTQTSSYYIDYPIMHIYVAISSLITDLNIKSSMSIIGALAVISTLFVYLIAKNITKDDTVSLLVALLINFADFHIRWSIEVIAMTFGVVLFTAAVYIIVNKDLKNQVIIQILLIASIILISWTHTISSFILLISIISLYSGSLFYELLYKRNKINSLVSFEKPFLRYNVAILFGVILIFHWMDPRYSFFQAVTRGIITALSQDASFLGRTDQYASGNLDSILNIFGFIIYLAFGIIGSLYSLSKINSNQKKFSLIFTQIILFFIFFVFPVFGIRNIMPDRWPAFIYVFFSIFIGLGLIQFINVISKKGQALFLLFIIFTSSFFMITDSSTNRDSPIYGEEINEKLVWSESEINMFTNVNELYDGVIVSDLQTIHRPFRTYLKRDKVNELPLNLDWNFIDDKMFIWREATLTSPIYDINGNGLILGKSFMENLEVKFNKVYDTGSSRAYLGELVF